MPQEKTEAVVLRGVDFGETSRIVTFLTPVRGKMACMAKGLRRKGSSLAAALDAFNRVELIYYWKDGRNVQILAEAALLDGFPGLRKDLEKGAFAAFPLELAYKTAHENEPSQALYTALAEGLHSLDTWSGDARAHCCWQIMQLLASAGFAPALDDCARCGGPLPASPGFSFEGGAACHRCGADRRLTAQKLEALRRLQAAAPPPEIKVDIEIFRMLRFYAMRQLDTEFRSVRVIEEMFG